jgi:hypothetical protein
MRLSTTDGDFEEMSRSHWFDDAASTAIVDVVASVENVPARMLEPLYDTIDPDALDALVAGENPVEISFEYEGHTVVVHGDGRLELPDTPSTAATDADPSAASD